eukprot:g56538.t1
MPNNGPSSLTTLSPLDMGSFEGISDIYGRRLECERPWLTILRTHLIWYCPNCRVVTGLWIFRFPLPAFMHEPDCVCRMILTQKSTSW